MDSSQANHGRIERWEWLLLGAFLAGGALLRSVFLIRAPGLWMDEAFNGLDALSVWREGGLRVFFEANNGREPLMIYLQALAVGLGGPTAVALRSASTVAGVATMPVVWLLAREYRGPRFAALALGVFAVMRWHVHFSGLGFRTILAPLFASLVFLFLFRYWRRGGWLDAVLCGAALGAGLLSYLSFRLVPVMVIFAVASHVLLVPVDRSLRQFGKSAGIIGGVALLVAAPMLAYFLTHPGTFSGRDAQIRILDRDDAGELLWQQARDVALMPLARGDHVGKHNLPGSPRFLQVFPEDGDRAAELWQLERALAGAEGREPMDPHGTGLPVFGVAGGLLFYLGLGLFAFGGVVRKDSAALAIIGWIVLGSLASILSFGAPNMLRLLLAAPAAALCIAAALEFCIDKAGARNRAAGYAVAGVLLAVYTWTEVTRAWRWAEDPVVRQGFNVEWRTIGDYLSYQPDRLPVRLPFEPISTLVFLADGYTFNPPREELGESWWEFRTVPPFPPLSSWGKEVSNGRRLEVVHPAGLKMGDLVETERMAP